VIANPASNIPFLLDAEFKEEFMSSRQTGSTPFVGFSIQVMNFADLDVLPQRMLRKEWGANLVMTPYTGLQPCV
jgi:hypothetical protein